MSIKKICSHIVLPFITALVFSYTASAQTLAWEPPLTGTVTGYKVYYSTTSGQYSANKDVGDVLRLPVYDLPLTEGKKYYFVVTAYNSAGESGYSNAVSWTAGDMTPPLAPIGFTFK